jgi:dihydrofolate reductase
MAARIAVTKFASLDGVMEAPGGEPEFKYPGWTFEFDRRDDGNQFKLDETRQSDGLLIGRRTYESFAGAWPQREGEFTDKFNSMPKFVVSTTLKDPQWTQHDGSRRALAARVASAAMACISARPSHRDSYLARQTSRHQSHQSHWSSNEVCPDTQDEPPDADAGRDPRDCRRGLGRAPRERSSRLADR